MKTTMLFCALLIFAGHCFAQSDGEEKVTIPKSMLTTDQRAQLAKEGIHDWVGLGKEIGVAVDSSLHAISSQSNDFAKTPVGKLTVVLVVWKIVGDQLVHIVFGLLELLIFMPLWIWSYRRTCITRAVKLPDKTVKVVEYTSKPESFTPRIAHCIAIALIVIMFLVTVFTY